MERTGRAGIGRFVMRGKEYLVAIRPDRQVLALETLFFADEVRDLAEELDNLPGKDTDSGKELDMATQLVECMASAWRPSGYHDPYRDRRAGGQRRPSDLAGASKTELTKMARELEVAGRSSMTADELAEAIDKARKDAPKARRAS